MGNVRHPKCAIRNMADEAKKRLMKNAYGEATSARAPQDASPSQQRIYIRMKQLLDEGREIDNPIQQLADRELMETLSHDDRQRYIFQLAADYIAMKKELDDKLTGGTDAG